MRPATYVGHVKLPGVSFDRGAVLRDNGVIVLAIDESGRILLISQYRELVGAPMLEAPGGGIKSERGETPFEAVLRELAEESGVGAGGKTLKTLRKAGSADVGEPVPLTWSHAAPYMTREVHFVYAVPVWSQVEVGRQKLDATEVIDNKLLWLPIDAAESAVLRTNEEYGISHAPTREAILAYSLLKRDLGESIRGALRAG